MVWFQYSKKKLQSLKAKAVLSALENKTGELLDVDCGNCFFSKQLKTCGFNVFAVDKPKVIRAQGQISGITLKACDLETGIPFESNRFDFALCLDVVEHINNTTLLFKELNRVLKKAGLLLLSTPYNGIAKNVLISLFGFDVHFNPEGEHIRFYSKKSIEKLLEKNNFKITKIDFIGRVWPFSAAIFVEANKKASL